MFVQCFVRPREGGLLRQAPARAKSLRSEFGSTYSLVHVDGVFASNNVRNGGALSLTGRSLSLGRHF